MNWIRFETALAIHDEQLAEHGGREGVDLERLEAALARPQNRKAYDTPEPDLFDFAATYAFAIGQGHPFIDGNKRTGWLCCETFLVDNGEGLLVGDELIVEIMNDVASRAVDETAFADWLRQHRLIQR